MRAAAPRFRVSRMMALLVCALALGGVLAAAQPADQPQSPVRMPAPDFLLKRPIGSIGVRGNWVFARAGSDLFDFLHEQLTIDKRDFRGPAVAADLAFAITPRIDAVFGLEFARASARSEYRDLVDDHLLPIEQTTALSTVHLIAGVRHAFVPPGYSVSRLAWVPRRVVPYGGAGVGAVRHKLTQIGDFVDYADQSVFSDNFRSEGWSPTAHVFGGVQLHVHRRLFATLESRYVWADAPLDPSFEDFEPMDLAGIRMSAGVNFVF
jgi:opacity protein-like surface antigen